MAPTQLGSLGIASNGTLRSHGNDGGGMGYDFMGVYSPLSEQSFLDKQLELSFGIISRAGSTVEKKSC